MDGDRTHKALLRIDTALARLEAAAQQPAGDESALAERHRALRAAVSATVSRLDALIESQQK